MMPFMACSDGSGRASYKIKSCLWMIKTLVKFSHAYIKINGKFYVKGLMENADYMSIGFFYKDG